MEDTSPPAVRSPFHRVQSELGATFMEEAGWLWTESFGDLQKEYASVRDDLGVWDVSPLNKWDFRGRDAMRAAGKLHSNRVSELAQGQVRYGAFCDGNGLMVDDGTVFKLAEDHAWIMTNGRDHEEHFAEATEGMTVVFEHIGLDLPHLGVLGPRAREALAPLCSVDIRGLPYFHFVPEQVKVGGVPCWVSRTGFGGELGFELFCRPAHAEDLWTVAVEKCRATPFGVEAIELLRVESGLIVLDYDYAAHSRTPYDFSLDRFVYLDGQDFLGRSSLASVAENPPRRFMTLVLATDELPEYGAAVSCAGQPAGVLTSPTKSPRFGPIGMAVLESRFAGLGTRVEVAMGDGAIQATVAALPIYDTEKRRPRA